MEEDHTFKSLAIVEIYVSLRKLCDMAQKKIDLQNSCNIIGLLMGNIALNACGLKATRKTIKQDSLLLIDMSERYKQLPISKILGGE